MKCPKCGRNNTKNIWHCDCGYEFELKEVKKVRVIDAKKVRNVNAKPRSFSRLTKGLLAGTLIIWLGFFSLKMIGSKPLVTDFSEEAQPAKGGEDLQDGSKAKPGEYIKPTGYNIDGLMHGVFSVGVMVLGSYIVYRSIANFVRSPKATDKG